MTGLALTCLEVGLFSPSLWTDDGLFYFSVTMFNYDLMLFELM